MLTIKIPPVDECWDERTEQFVPGFRGATIKLEHSLVSLSKWESKWHLAFLEKKNRTREEFLDYIKCMTITQNVDDEAYDYLTEANYKEITDYINNPMSATKFYDGPEAHKVGKSHKTVTSERLYCAMVQYGIPFECEKWHLNRLTNLIRLCSDANNPPKKMSKREMFDRNRAINAANKKRFNTRG